MNRVRRITCNNELLAIYFPAPKSDIDVAAQICLYVFEFFIQPVQSVKRSSEWTVMALEPERVKVFQKQLGQTCTKQPTHVASSSTHFQITLWPAPEYASQEKTNFRTEPANKALMSSRTL